MGDAYAGCLCCPYTYKLTAQRPKKGENELEIQVFYACLPCLVWYRAIVGTRVASVTPVGRRLETSLAFHAGIFSEDLVGVVLLIHSFIHYLLRACIRERFRSNIYLIIHS